MKKLQKFITTALLLWPYLAQATMPMSLASNLPWMPQPGSQVTLSQAFTPTYLWGLTIHPNEPFTFDFLVRDGDDHLSDLQKKIEYTKLMKYFLAALAVPDTEQWVNLSPYEKDRIIPDTFGNTEMGRDLLAQDYLLKQLSASLTNPDSTLGKKFWDEVYAKAQEHFGSSEVSPDIFNKVWIMPDKAVIYEKDNTVFVQESRLKVLTEKDYLAMSQNNTPNTIQTASTADIAFEILKDIIVPALEKEINEGQSFAPLRQVYSGMLLATWYKRTLKETLLGALYADQNKVAGISQDPAINQKIYEQYVTAFQKGVVNLIKEDLDPASMEIIPKKYFSGGTLGYTQTPLTFGNDLAQQSLLSTHAAQSTLITVALHNADAAQSEDTILHQRVALTTNKTKIWSIAQDLIQVAQRKKPEHVRQTFVQERAAEHLAPLSKEEVRVLIAQVLKMKTQDAATRRYLLIVLKQFHNDKIHALANALIDYAGKITHISNQLDKELYFYAILSGLTPEEINALHATINDLLEPFRDDLSPPDKKLLFLLSRFEQHRITTLTNHLASLFTTGPDMLSMEISIAHFLTIVSNLNNHDLNALKESLAQLNEAFAPTHKHLTLVLRLITGFAKQRDAAMSSTHSPFNPLTYAWEIVATYYNDNLSDPKKSAYRIETLAGLSPNQINEVAQEVKTLLTQRTTLDAIPSEDTASLNLTPAQYVLLLHLEQLHKNKTYVIADHIFGYAKNTHVEITPHEKIKHITGTLASLTPGELNDFVVQIDNIINRQFDGYTPDLDVLDTINSFRTDKLQAIAITFTNLLGSYSSEDLPAEILEYAILLLSNLTAEDIVRVKDYVQHQLKDIKINYPAKKILTQVLDLYTSSTDATHALLKDQSDSAMTPQGNNKDPRLIAEDIVTYSNIFNISNERKIQHITEQLAGLSAEEISVVAQNVDIRLKALGDNYTPTIRLLHIIGLFQKDKIGTLTLDLIEFAATRFGAISKDDKIVRIISILSALSKEEIADLQRRVSKDITRVRINAQTDPELTELITTFDTDAIELMARTLVNTAIHHPFKESFNKLLTDVRMIFIHLTPEQIRAVIRTSQNIINDPDTIYLSNNDLIGIMQSFLPASPTNTPFRSPIKEPETKPRPAAKTNTHIRLIAHELILISVRESLESRENYILRNASILIAPLSSDEISALSQHLTPTFQTDTALRNIIHAFQKNKLNTLARALLTLTRNQQDDDSAFKQQISISAILTTLSPEEIQAIHTMVMQWLGTTAISDSERFLLLSLKEYKEDKLGALATDIFMFGRPLPPGREITWEEQIDNVATLTEHLTSAELQIILDYLRIDLKTIDPTRPDPTPLIKLLDNLITQKSNVDAAMQADQTLEQKTLNPGGIDMASSDLNLIIKKDNNGILLPLPQQNPDGVQINGLIPVILNIQPAIDSNLFASFSTKP